MQHPCKKDKHWIIDLLSKAFEDNKSVRTICAKSKTIPTLMEYCFVHSHVDNLCFINETKTAAALCSIPGREKFHFRKLIVTTKLLTTLGLKKSLLSLKRENLIKAQHPKKNYLHVKFIGVDPNRQGARIGSALIEEIKDYALELNLPLYLETSTLINLPFYEKHGFENFHTMTGVHDYALYFFKYSHEQINR